MPRMVIELTWFGGPDAAEALTSITESGVRSLQHLINAGTLRADTSVVNPWRGLRLDHDGGLVEAFNTVQNLRNHFLRFRLEAREICCFINRRSVESIARDLAALIDRAVDQLKMTRNWIRDPRIAEIRRDLKTGVETTIS